MGLQPLVCVCVCASLTLEETASKARNFRFQEIKKGKCKQTSHIIPCHFSFSLIASALRGGNKVPVSAVTGLIGEELLGPGLQSLPRKQS